MAGMNGRLRHNALSESLQARGTAGQISRFRFVASQDRSSAVIQVIRKFLCEYVGLISVPNEQTDE
ncbi:hypothetical protein SBA5_1040003 [Candidatus Sulfotelmatomonas gaucii]|uniref:Uncharacterized protein n=1 Tax=Candidatus Sulfuritelmatomonas gaucii TaxID=2043161 RepID=A0A2N9L2Q2_9BACT|nr:hypothetical protein SBA5_1040003 [Candidatus Sulfotelmatomonas gaucii]